jgi:hypothetical protein
MIRISRSVTAGLLAVLVAAAVAFAVALAPHGAGAAAPPIPSTPGPITVSAITMNSANLAWTPSQAQLGIEGYQVFRQQTAGVNPGPMVQIATTDGGITHYTAQNLYAGSTYTFSIKAIDTAGQTSTTPSTTSFSTLTNADSTAPAAPSTNSVAAHAFSDTRIDVVWAGAAASVPVSGYLVFRSTDLSTPIGRVDLPGGLRFSDNGLTPSTSYTYQIESISSNGVTSAPTSASWLSATTSTLATGTVQLQRGPYLSNVTATSAVVSWWTNIASTGVVHYGVGNTNASVASASAQHHAVTLTGLTGNSTYSYTVSYGTTSTAVTTFKTAAAPGTSFSFAAIGDFGGAAPGESQNAANIAAAGTSFVQTLGDNIYPSAGLPDPNFSTTYSDFDARFFKQFGPVIKNQAFFPANGNQEYYSGGKFWDTFPMPGSNHSWYSYNWGNAHILVLDTELPFDTNSAQYAFAKADLAANQGAAFRIVAMQRPPYSSVSSASSSQPARTYLVPLFQQYKVSLVLSGNSHNYERTFPLVNGTPASGGVTYVVSGGGGNGHNPFTLNPAPAYSAHRDDVNYEYTKVTVTPTTITVNEINAATNASLDSATITSSTAPATTTAYIASSRQGSAVYINALVKQQSGSTITRSAGRTVYLQRLLNGSWQNMLSRPTDSAGQFTVGFVQGAVFTYRLYVLPSGNATAAYSATTTR